MTHGIHPEAKLYNHVNISNSILKEFVSIGDFSKIQNSTIEENARIDRHNHIDSSNIGRYSYTGRNTMILHAKIGSFCSISWNVSIGGANHDYTRMTQHSFLYNEYDKIRPDGVDAPYDRFLAPVTVGNDVWIAAGVVVARGVTIGDGAVIGANAVVTRDVPPYAIVAGAPARIIKYRFEPDMVDFLLELKWWFWPVEEIKKQFSLLSDKPSLDNLKESFTV